MIDEPDCLKLLGEHRRGEAFDVAGHRFVDFVSHGTVLEDCTVRIRGSARGIVFHGATLERCRIESRRRFVGFSWHDVILDRCVFTGQFLSCDFGPRPDVYPDHPAGRVLDCDFSQAQLHSCRFFNSDMRRIVWPKWPCFTVLDPEQNAKDWLSIPFPDSYRTVEQALIAEAVADFQVKGVIAACEHAGEMAKKHKVTPEEIHALIAGKSYIVH